MDQHNHAVNEIAESVRRFYDRKQPFRIYHGSTNSTRTQGFQHNRTVDTSGLNHVLDIDVASKTALVEPNVPMDKLVQETLKYGLIPPVVMEFPGITVGGGFAGTSGESSSFKYGFFDKTVNWIEMVLADGDVVEASKTNKADLFIGAAGSFGTLGVTTLLELRLIDAKTYVELTYWPVKTVSEAIRKLETSAEDSSIDYLDGIIFSLTSGVIVTGKLTDTPSKTTKIQRFTRARDPWFFVHAKRAIAKSTEPIVVASPLVDYLFRYDRGAFWTGIYAYRYFLVPFNRITRWALDYFMHTRVMYHALHESGFASRYIIQDIALPQSTTEEFIEYIDKEFGFYPLWLCPLHKKHDEISLHPHTSTPETREQMLINVGVWGPGPARQKKFVKVNRDLEQKVRDLSGMKWLYAHTYYTKKEFWSIYDKEWYDALRVKYDATSLPSVYDKVKVDITALKSSDHWFWKIWPLAGLYGVYKACSGSSYLMARKTNGLRLLVLALGLCVVLIAILLPILIDSHQKLDRKKAQILARGV